MAKIGFDPICYGTAVTAQRQLHSGRTATAQWNGTTATAERQNGMLETRH